MTYALGIYILNLFIAFLTPKIDPALQDLDGKNIVFLMNQLFHVHVLGYVIFTCFPVDDGPSLPTKSNEEFRPFMRRLPEFKFWWVSKFNVIM